MSQPWLDDLSEDWDDRPPFSSPPPLHDTPSKVSIGRIPRLPSSPALATVLSGSGDQNNDNTSPTRDLPGKRKEALAERSGSDNNILSNSNESHSRSVSASSTGSVVNYGTVEVKPPTSSPSRPKKLQDTPEWKRRLVHGKMGYGDQKDLFSPMGLENMFQPPTQPRPSPIYKRRPALAALKDSFALPSSPPPWPSQLAHNRNSPARNSMRFNFIDSALDNTADYDSHASESEDDSKSEAGSEVRYSHHEDEDNASEAGSEVRYSHHEDEDNVSETGSEVRHSHHSDDDVSENGSEPRYGHPMEDEAQDASFQESHAQENASKLKHESKFGRLTPLDIPSAQNSRLVSGQTELTDDSFGPVYITKHRTENGGVEYAAVDLSKSELEKMRNPAAERNPSQRSNFGESLHSYGSQRSEPLPEDLPTGTPEPIAVGDFANAKRGGFSTGGSSQKRPLSPSPLGRKNSSSSVDDAASLSNPSASAPVLERPPSHLRHQLIKQRSSPPISPTTPARRPNSSYLHPDRPQSSSSPLKLFGDHDTFTAAKLQRRMSQLEDTLYQEEYAGEGRRQSGGAAKRIEPRLPSVEEASFQPRSVADKQYDNDGEASGFRQAFGESASSHFGRGDLDDYPFPDGSFRDSQNSQESSQDDRSGSPPPDAAPRFQFSLNDGFMEQRIHTKRKLSRHTVKSWTTTVSNRNSIKIPKSPRVGARKALAAHNELEGTDGKRPPTSPFRNPSAKRRRTLLPMDMEAHEDVVPYAMKENREPIRTSLERRSQENPLERYLHSEDPSMIARRNLLRPRNPTPSQRRREQIQADILEATEAYLHSSPKGLRVIQEHLESPQSHDRASNNDNERAVASQIAAFSVKLRLGMKDEDRKRSVTTQDFLDEARLIMDHIRTKGRPNSALQSLAESDPETPTHAHGHTRFDSVTVPESPLTFSRPPSREGSKGGWRNPGDSTQNPRVVSHLRKFREEDGEDFMTSSFRSINVKQLEERTQDDSDFFQDQSPDIRVLTNNLTQRRRERGQSDANQLHSRESSHGDSQQSRPSTMESSLGRTNLTTFSRRSDNVATLAPEAVAHLIPQEIAGMTFDRDIGRWVKRKNDGIQVSSVEVSHFTNSEDDPLRNIPDLTVDEAKERKRMSQLSSSPEPLKYPQDEDDVFFDSFAASASPYKHTEPSSDTARPTTREGADIPPSDTNSAPSKFSSHFSSSGTQAETRATSMSDRHANYIPKHIRRQETIPEVASPQLNEDYDQEFKRFDSQDRQKTESFFFPSNKEDHNSVIEDLSKMDSRTQNAFPRFGAFGNEGQDIPTPLRNEFTGPKPKFSGYRRVTKQTVTDYSPSLSPARDAELSVVKCPDSEQRRMKFKLSVSKPAGSPAVVPQSPVNPYNNNPHGYADVTFVLSELPPFTVSGEDERELPNRTLVKRKGSDTINVLEDRFAQGTIELVKALQDNEPEEPFWEELRRLDLQKKDLPTLNRLDELCYRIEALDVSNNHIAQLAGAPPSIRRLNISNNCLNSLTSWSHLTNLQYLDVSGNSIDSLKGFSMLVHLRELKADANEVESLEGVMELDGLLKLSLKGNKIKKVDFQGTYL